MDINDGYDYSASLPFLQAFVNPFTDKEFIDEMPENYGSLWCFNDNVEKWTFGISKFKKYVYLLHQERHCPAMLPINVNEKVTLVHPFHQEYILIALQAVDDTGAELRHIHSIVVKVGSEGAQFDFDGFIKQLPGTAMESLAPEMEAKYSPWLNTSGDAVYRRLSQIFTNIDRYVIRGEPVMPPLSARRLEEPRLQNTSGADGSISRATTDSRSRAPPRVRSADAPPTAEPIRKRRKSTGTGGSSGSVVTHVEGRRGKAPADTTADYEKHAQTQSQFWESCGDCFCFGQKTFEVAITQCILAKDEYIIRKLENDIVKSVKKELVQLGDVKQRQKVCLTPIDSQGRLLREKPLMWSDIKDGKFMIINGQHSITASKELQSEGCAEKRKKELASWDAYIVWSLDPIKLHNISKFYNSTNHLSHAQPTWGWQLISGRNIWIAQGRPTDKAGEAEARGNRAVLSPSKYAVHSPHKWSLDYPRVEDNCLLLWFAKL